MKLRSRIDWNFFIIPTLGEFAQLKQKNVLQNKGNKIFDFWVWRSEVKCGTEKFGK